jgi:hypothetical protein
MRKYCVIVYSGAWVIRVEHPTIKNSSLIVHSKSLMGIEGFQGSNVNLYLHDNLYFDSLLDGDRFFIENEHRISDDGYYYNEQEWREIQLNKILIK